MVEHSTFNRMVDGSNPSGLTTPLFCLASGKVRVRREPEAVLSAPLSASGARSARRALALIVIGAFDIIHAGATGYASIIFILARLA